MPTTACVPSSSATARPAPPPCARKAARSAASEPDRGHGRESPRDRITFATSPRAIERCATRTRSTYSVRETSSVQSAACRGVSGNAPAPHVSPSFGSHVSSSGSMNSAVAALTPSVAAPASKVRYPASGVPHRSRKSPNARRSAQKTDAFPRDRSRTQTRPCCQRMCRRTPCPTQTPRSPSIRYAARSGPGADSTARNSVTAAPRHGRAGVADSEREEGGIEDGRSPDVVVQGEPPAVRGRLAQQAAAGPDADRRAHERGDQHGRRSASRPPCDERARRSEDVAGAGDEGGTADADAHRERAASDKAVGVVVLDAAVDVDAGVVEERGQEGRRVQRDESPADESAEHEAARDERRESDVGGEAFGLETRVVGKAADDDGAGERGCRRPGGGGERERGRVEEEGAPDRGGPRHGARDERPRLARDAVAAARVGERGAVAGDIEDVIRHHPTPPQGEDDDRGVDGRLAARAGEGRTA